MKRYLALCLLTLGLFFATSPDTAHAQVRAGGNFGIGLGGGSGTSGISMKYFLADSHALQGVVGIWGLGRGELVVGLTGDYLFEGPALFSNGTLEIGWNVGFGPFLGVGDAFWLGVNGVLGLEFNLDFIPLDIVVEYRPGVLILPGVDPDLLNFTGHIRYYF